MDSYKDTLKCFYKNTFFILAYLFAHIKNRVHTQIHINTYTYSNTHVPKKHSYTLTYKNRRTKFLFEEKIGNVAM